MHSSTVCYGRHCCLYSDSIEKDDKPTDNIRTKCDYFISEVACSTYTLLQKLRAQTYTLLQKLRAQTYTLLQKLRAQTYTLLQNLRAQTYTLLQKLRAQTYTLLQKHPVRCLFYSVLFSGGTGALFSTFLIIFV